jgi:hypothetical protein
MKDNRATYIRVIRVLVTEGNRIENNESKYIGMAAHARVSKSVTLYVRYTGAMT